MDTFGEGGPAGQQQCRLAPPVSFTVAGGDGVCAPVGAKGAEKEQNQQVENRLNKICIRISAQTPDFRAFLHFRFFQDAMLFCPAVLYSCFLLHLNAPGCVHFQGGAQFICVILGGVCNGYPKL